MLLVSKGLRFGWWWGLRLQPTGVSLYPLTMPSTWPLRPIQQSCIFCLSPFPTRVALAEALTRPIVLPDLI